MSRVSNTSDVREYNTQLVRDYLRQVDSATKSNIATATNLSIASCTNFLNNLIENHEVIETGPIPSSGGRPAKQYALNADFHHFLVASLHKKGDLFSIRVAVLNLKDEILTVENHNFEEHFAYSILKEMIEEYITEYPAIKSIGIGVPGIPYQGVITGSHIEALNNFPLQKTLLEDFQMEVRVENDMYFTSYGFYTQKELEDNPIMTVVMWDEKEIPGASSIVHSELIEGMTKFSGELSYLPFFKEKNNDLELISKTLASIVVSVNPNIVILTGHYISAFNCEDITDYMKEYIPEQHLPEIRYIEDTENEYLFGIYTILLEDINYIL